ncbi:hypothetical protein ACFRNJ_12375 [Streptomyces sp. NPDC056721]|uniref:hypothetical protein n=1 Tax=Streptomyces sp. NPDC056721 TaxID=3345923 RepID=UPI0036C1735D
MNKPGGIVTTKAAVYAHFAEKGIDADAAVKAWIEAWADKVPAGTQMILARMKCALADGPCGCPPNAYIYKCKGPYLGIPVEILIDALFPPDGSPCAVPGVEGLELPGPEYFMKGDGTGVEQEFLSETLVKYIQKV